MRATLDRYALLALALTIFAWAPLLSPNYFMGAHDATHSVFFPLQFHKGIMDGYWLPRWASDVGYGYGYPLFVFYAPLSFYIWESFHATGLFGVVASTKATFIIGFLLAAAGIYTYARTLWGRRAGLLAAVVYTYLPYHLLNIYVRAALAEFMAMSFLPWIALAFHHLIRRPSPARIAAAAGTYGALLWTHNITAVLFTPFLGAMILVEIARAPHLRVEGRRGGDLVMRILPVGAAVLLGVAISTAVWLPSLAEQPFIKIEQWAQETYRYADHFVYPTQFLSATWGFGYSGPGPQDGMSFQLGWAALGLAVVGLLALRVRFPAASGVQQRPILSGKLLPERPTAYDAQPEADRPAVGRRTSTASHQRLGPVAATKSGRRSTPPADLSLQRGMYIFWAIALLVAIALMLPPAVALWDLNPLSTLVQFPWRLLTVAGLSLALVASSSASLFRGRHSQGITPGLALAVLTVLLASLSYTQPQPTAPDPRDETQQTWQEYERKHPNMVAMVAQSQVQPTTSPMLAALEADETPLRFVTEDPDVSITQLHTGGASGTARVEALRPATIVYQTYWYPGWTATLDGREVAARPDGGALGLIAIDVPAGEHLLTVRFGDPPLRRVANLISLVSLLLLGGLVLLSFRARQGNVF